MPGNDATVVIGAQVGEAQASLKELNASLNSVQETIQSINSIAATFASLWAVDEVAHFGEEVLKAGIEMQNLHYQMIAATGSTDNAAQAMDFARDVANRYGMDLKDTAQGLSDFSMNAIRSGMSLKETERVFEDLTIGIKAMHLSVAQTNRTFYALQEMMSLGQVQTRQLRMLNMDAKISFETMAQAMGMTSAQFKELVEKGGVVANDFLPKLGAELHKQFGQVAKEASDSLQSNLGRMNTAWLDLQQAFNQNGGMDAANVAVKAIIVVLDDLKPVAEYLATVLQVLESLWIGLGVDIAECVEQARFFIDVMAELVGGSEKYGVALHDSLGGNFKAAAAEIAEANAQITGSVTHAADIYEQNMARINANAQKALDGIWKPQKEKKISIDTGDGGGGGAGGGKSRVSEWDRDLQHMLYTKHLFFDEAENAEIDYWDKILSTQRVSATERDEIEKKVHTLQQRMIQEDVQAFEAGIKQKQAEAGNDYVEVIRLEIQKMQMLKKIYGEGSHQYQQVLAEKAHMDAKHLADMKQAYQKTFMNVAGYFNDALRGMINGTTTFRQAIANLLEDLLFKFIEVIEGMVAKWAAGQIANTVMAEQQDAAKIGSTATSAAANGAILHGFTATAIATDAAAAYAGVFASLAPFMGPLAAGPASIAYGDVMAAETLLPSFDVGSWSVPGDMTARIHQGEMIVPKTFAQSMRENGGLGGQGTTYIINAMDGKSVERVLRNNAGAVARAASASNRNFDRGSRL